MKEKEKVENTEEKENIKESIKRKLAKKDEEIEKAKADCEHWKNEYYRVYADIANLRKEIEKDHRDVIKYRIEGFVDKLIPTMDAFDMEQEFKTNRYNQNRSILKNLCNQMGVSTSSTTPRPRTQPVSQPRVITPPNNNSTNGSEGEANWGCIIAIIIVGIIVYIISISN